MRSLAAAVRHLLAWLAHLSTATLVLAVALVALASLTLPALSQRYRAEIEQSVGAYLHAPVRIESLHLAWRDRGPALRIDGFRLYDPAGRGESFGFRNAWIHLDVMRSLRAGRPVLHHIRLRGGEITLAWGAPGSLRLLSNIGAGDDAMTVRELGEQLSMIGALDFEFDELKLRDDASGRIHTLGRDLRLALRGEGMQRRLEAVLTPAPALGRELHGVARLSVDPDQPGQWRANFYLQGKGMVPAAWPLARLDMALPGPLDLELWGDSGPRGLDKLTGKAALAGMTIDFVGKPAAPGWQWQGHWRGQTQAGAALDSAFDLRVQNEAAGQSVTGMLGPLQVETLAALAAPWLDARQAMWLAALAPRGRLPELVLRWVPATRDFSLSGRFEGVGTNAWGRIPGVSGLSGALSLRPSGGRIDLDAGAVAVAWQPLRAPLTVDTLRGPLEWRAEDSGLRLESSGIAIANADFKAELHGSVSLVAGAGPVLDLQGEYHDVAVARINRYVPVAILHPKVTAWLDRALVGGRVPAGTLMFKGRAQDFPFDQGQGLFEVRFDVTDMTFDYFHDWPVIDGLAATVVFRNRSFSADASAGRIFDARLGDVKARIADLDHGVLTIEGEASGAGETMLRFVRASPLDKKFGADLAGIEVSGVNRLDLDLTIPLNPDPTRVKGSVQFSGGSVSVPEHDVELKQVRGALNFSNDGVGARDLQALFRGSPVRLDIDTRAQRKIGKVVDFRLSGQFGAAALFGAQAAAFAPYLQGQSDWDVLLSVPERRPGVPGAVQIKLDSDLGGMAVQLPQPLAKTGKAKRAFSARIAITESALDLSLEYAPDVRAVLVLARSAKTVRLTRGELRIASGDAKLPAEPGLKIVARLPHLDLAMLGAGSALPIPVSGVDARIDEIGLAGAVLRDTQVQMQPRAGALAIRLTGKDVAGTLQVPTEARASQPLQIRLERLALRRTTGRETADDGGAARDGDPRQWPPLEVDIGELFVNDRSLGRLHFATAPTAQGLRLRELQLRSDWHQLSVEGDWRITADGASSRLQAQFASRELGRSLAAFGYELALAKGDAKAQATLAWPGGFADFSLAALQGQLKLHIGKGQLLQVDPGMGRVIGLLNLYALTRRLQLDFSDLFEDGLAFDEISGRLDFGNGKAQIDHLTLSGPAAQIAVGGSLDLQHKRFDQTIAVMPRLGAPLALAGAVAGGPVVGAAVLVAEQLLKPGIGKIVRYQYQVTGPWDDPVVERDGGAPGDHSATSGFKR